MAGAAGTPEPAGRTELRASTPADAAFLASVYASTRPLELAMFSSSPTQQAAFVESQASLQERAYADSYPTSRFEIVEVDGAPAGRVFIGRGETELRVVDIALLLEYRGRGIGTQLLRGVLTEAAGRGIGVGLRVDRGNPAERLYARLGFVVEASTETNVAMRWNPPGSAPVPTPPAGAASSDCSAPARRHRGV